MDLLAGRAREKGDRALLAVTSDPRKIPCVDGMIKISDGRVVGEPRPNISRAVSNVRQAGG